MSLVKNVVAAADDDENEQAPLIVSIDADENVDDSASLPGGWRNYVAFWVAGLVNNFGYVVMLSAATDLLDTDASGVAKKSPALVLLLNILPGFIVQLVCPWMQDRIPWNIRMLFTVLLGTASFLLTALIANVWVRLLGVALGSMGSSFGEMTCLAYSAHFHKNTVSAWSSGTGAAGLLGALAYLLMTGPIGLSYWVTLVACSWVPAIEGIMFVFVMNTRVPGRPEPPLAGAPPPPLPESAINADNDLSVRSDTAAASAFAANSTLTQRSASARYAASFDDTASSGVRSAPPSFTDFADPTNVLLVPSIKDEAAMASVPLSFGARLRLLVRLLPYMLPLAVVYFAEYLINQSVYATVFYADGAGVPCHLQYKVLQLCYQAGVLISRSSVNLYRLKNIVTLQLPAIFQAINLLVLSLNVTFMFLPSIWLVIAFAVWEGLMGGSIYANVFYMVSERFHGRDKEFVLGSTTQAYGLSITMAAVCGIFYFPFLLDNARVADCGGTNTTMVNMTTSMLSNGTTMLFQTTAAT
jgi:battenin